MPLRLTSTRLSLFCDPGLAPPKLARFATTAGVLVLGLTGIGGFSIIGTKVVMYETVKVRNKVVAAKDNYIDFRDHVSEDGKLVSGTVLLIQRSMCVRNSRGKFNLYGMANDLADLTSVKWPPGAFTSKIRGNGTSCLMSSSGFQDEVVLELINPVQPSNSTICSLNINVSDVAKNRITRLLTSAVDARNCPFQVPEVWCSNYHRLRCAGSPKYSDGFGDILIFADRGVIGYDETPFRTKMRRDPEQLKSMAFLADSGVITPPRTVAVLQKMVSLRVQSNAEVKRILGKKNVTLVNVALLASTLGPAVFITFLTGLIAYRGWTIFVARAGRRGYNTFNSASDALSCANVEAFQDGGCRFRREGGAFFEVKGCQVRPTRVKM